MHHSSRPVRLVFNSLRSSTYPSLRRPFPTPRSAQTQYPFSISNVTGTPCQLLPRRAFSNRSGSVDELFNYSSGRWLANEDLRLAERKCEFNVDELRQLAAQSVGRSPQDIKTFVKLAEGGFNRTFLITMHDGFQMVARIPYPITVPKFYSIASEAATMRYLRSSGLPVPEVYDYSPSPDNAAKTEYIFMEYMRGTTLADVWFELEESAIVSVLRQLVELESRMMAITFPAGGSLYYAKDLEEVGMTGVPLEVERFSIGPDARLHMWYGRRSQLNVDRGPYRNVEATLVAAAHKEQAYLDRFGRPLQPFLRERREHYDFKEQTPLDHSKNLERYLLVAHSLIPKNSDFHRFHIRHPDLQPGNVIVSISPDSNQLEIVGLIDWQHASILPQFLHADVPRQFQNYDDPFSQLFIPPSLPENLDQLDPSEQYQAQELYRTRLVHFHYVQYTKEYNKPHHDALWDSVCMLIRRLFSQAGDPWEGETHALKVSLIEVMERWEELVGKDIPCPILFESEDIRKTKELSEKLKLGDENYKMCEAIVGFQSGLWVPNERYELSQELAAVVKKRFFEISAEDPELRDKLDKFEANWLLDDMDETDYK